MSDDEAEQCQKSHSSELIAFATFISTTNREVNVFWLDYNGERVRYATLPPRCSYHIDTFKTHPWIFRDSQTDEPLLANNKQVYYPLAWGEEMDRRHNVLIGIPVYSLASCCMRMIKANHPPEHLPHLCLPCNLHRKYLDRHAAPHREYED